MSCAIVGIGASAGGLGAIEQFFTALNSKLGIAFVLVQHLEPSHPSLLVGLLSKWTELPVSEAHDGVTVLPDHIYVIPPDHYLTISDGQLHTLARRVNEGLVRLPVDVFFRALAKECGSRCAGIVLSGSGSDGTLGLTAIHEEGGLTLAQDPSTAAFEDMPRSAIGTGLIDQKLQICDMPFYLENYFSKVLDETATLPLASDGRGSAKARTLAVLREHTGHDFSDYKQTTIERRIERRMLLNQIQSEEDYLIFLERHPGERERLHRELLIGVTSFFRDPEPFEVLEKIALTSIISEDETADRPIRFWVAGCSTGEEVYSIAMLAHERLDSSPIRRKITIFASDIDRSALEKARLGAYSPGIAGDVSDVRLKRFFFEQEGVYKVKPSLSESIIFVEHSVFKDTPFSRLDLISCRNLLIYLQPELQQKTLALFHYALKPNGFLFLGNSESVGANEALFRAVDKSGGLFQRVEGSARKTPCLAPVAKRLLNRRMDEGVPLKSLKNVVEQELLVRYCPTAAVLDGGGELLYIHGPAAPFLKPLEGIADLHLLNMISEDLKLELISLLSEVRVNKRTVASPTIYLTKGGEKTGVTLIVSPFEECDELSSPRLLVVFRKELGPIEAIHTGETSEVSDDPRYAELERELWSTRQYLKKTIQQLESTNEEFRCTNEELQSSNEELQSTNEELETSREELQAVNEELTTLNSELQATIEESSLINDDLKNLLSSIEIAVVFLDNSLRVTRYTPAVARIIHLLPADRGRYFGDINSRLEIRPSHLLELVEAVLSELKPYHQEMKSQDGLWYAMSILPYRRSDNTIEGVVLTFLDITSQKTVQESLRLCSVVCEQSQIAMALTNPTGEVIYTNRAGVDIFPMGEVPLFVKELNSDSWSTLRAGKTWQSGLIDGKRRVQVSPVGEPGALLGLVLTNQA